jgi:hypothetical protein
LSAPHPGQLIATEQAQNACRDCHDGVVGIAAGSTLAYGAVSVALALGGLAVTRSIPIEVRHSDA